MAADIMGEHIDPGMMTWEFAHAFGPQPAHIVLHQAERWANDAGYAAPHAALRALLLTHAESGSLLFLLKVVPHDGQARYYECWTSLDGANVTLLALLEQLSRQEQLIIRFISHSGTVSEIEIPNPGMHEFRRFSRLISTTPFRHSTGSLLTLRRLANSPAEFWPLAGAPWLLGDRNPYGAAFKIGCRKADRNDPCPCGSGRKYKKCHGHGPAPSQLTAVTAPTDPQFWLQEQWSHSRVPFIRYPEPLPPDLLSWYLYTHQHGHCVVVQIESDRTDAPTTISTMPVRLIRELPYRLDNGWLMVPLRPSQRALLRSTASTYIEFIAAG